MKRNSIFTIMFILAVMVAGIQKAALCETDIDCAPQSPYGVTDGTEVGFNIVNHCATHPDTSYVSDAGTIYLKGDTATGDLIASGTLRATTGIRFSDGGDIMTEFSHGTFEPRYYGSTNDGSESCTYTNQNGYYTRIGDFVHFSVRIAISSCSTAPTGAPRIGGLPYTAQSTLEGIAISYMNTYALTSTTKVMGGVVNGSSVWLYEYDTAGAAATNPPIDTAFEIWFSGNLVIAP